MHFSASFDYAQGGGSEGRLYPPITFFRPCTCKAGCDFCGCRPSNYCRADLQGACNKESRTASNLCPTRLTPSRIRGTLTGNERNFRLGEHPGCTSSFFPEKFLCYQLPELRRALACQPRMNASSSRRLASDPT